MTFKFNREAYMEQRRDEGGPDVRVLSDKIVRVKKQRKCICGFNIEVGEQARRVVDITDGEFKCQYYHPHWDICCSEKENA